VTLTDVRSQVIPPKAQAGLYSVANRHLGRVAPQEAPAGPRVDVQDLSLGDFVRQGWQTLNPAKSLVSTWYVDCIAEHLEAVTRGEIQNLLVNMPPRALKSTTISVMWMPWVWTRQPWLRWLFNSYAQDLSLRDALASRRLIESGWFQARWGHIFQLTDDQNRKERYDNTRTGYRVSSSVTGQNTGEGGDITVTDDPHNVLKGESDAERQTVLTWHSEVMPTRVTDYTTHRDVVVMQRVHENDLSGAILASERGYHHLCLPVEYVPTKTYVAGTEVVDAAKPQPHCDCPVYPDPRTTEGETLDPERFPPAVIASLQKSLKAYAYSGQMQQRPVPRTGALFSEELFRPLPRDFDRPNEYGVSARQALLRVAYFDLTYSEKTAHDHAAGVVIGIDPVYNAYVLAVWRVLEPHSALAVEAADWLKALRPTSRPEMIYVEEAAYKKAPTQNWARQMRDLLRAMAIATPIDTVPVATDKYTRAALVSDHGKVGQLFADKNAPWWTTYIGEHLAFPKSDENDQVDATAGALQAAMTIVAKQPPGQGPEKMQWENAHHGHDADVQAWLDSAFDSVDRGRNGLVRAR
jgi:predicted phage terminase large subunit-like protein